MSFKASAPGSLMLLGEYGVLHGMPALVCAVDKRIHVTLTPRYDREIHIHSDILGHYVTNLDALEMKKPFHFVLGAVKQFREKMHTGCDLQIESDFSDKVGLGSSAAVTVATIAAIVTWLDIRMNPIDLVRQARNVIRDQQGGLGSGADVAAAVYGGVVYYQAQPLAAEKLEVELPISLFYVGFKTPTAQAIKTVQARFADYPNVFKQLCVGIGQCATDGMHQIRKKNWAGLGDMMNIQQGLMESLGVNLPVFQYMAETLRAQNNISGVKISGSGLGDCLIALGKVDADFKMGGEYADVQQIPVEMSLHGVRSQKN